MVRLLKKGTHSLSIYYNKLHFGFYAYICINRLVCSTIERGYAPSEAREIRAMASFHNPNGFLYGYIRMVRL